MEIKNIDILHQKTALAVRDALERSNNRAMINVKGMGQMSPIDIAKLSDLQALHLLPVTTEQLMRSDKPIVNDGTGIVVIGFNNGFIGNEPVKKALHKIRAFGNGGGRILLLTDDLVDGSFFRPDDWASWMNNPFPDDGMWSMDAWLKGIQLQQYELIRKVGAIPTWGKKGDAKQFRL